MKKIEIDSEVFAFLQSKAIAFVEQPNDTLRRLLGIDNRQLYTHMNMMQMSKIGGETDKKKKGPRTDLKRLVQAGLLKEGQVLFMHDYKGNKIAGKEAIVSNGKLLYEGKEDSMSKIAQKLLVEAGYAKTFVRGPIFWKNEEGISVKSLWTRYQSNNF